MRGRRWRFDLGFVTLGGMGNPVPPEIDKLARTLDMSGIEWQQACEILSKFGQDFLNRLPNTPANHANQFVNSGSLVPPDGRQELNKVFSDFTALALTSGIEPTSPRFFGYIPGGGMPAAAIGDAVAALSNRYAGMAGASPGAVDIENQVVRWIRHLLNWPEESWGTLLSGGSTATLTAIVAARSTRDASQWSTSSIYVSEQTHHCFYKAALVAGLESSHFRFIKCDANGRMCVETLRAQLQKDRLEGLSPWIICANAGTTNLGAIDPLMEISNICKEQDIWMHVDAAYGGFFWLVEEGKMKLAGMELGDSIVLDPHKGMFQPYGLGMVLVRNAKTLNKSLANDAAYLRDMNTGTMGSPADYSPELTRHFRSLRLWFSLKHHGLAAFRAAIEEKLILTKHVTKELRLNSSLHVFAEPDLTVAAFRVAGSEKDATNEKTQTLLKTLLTEGRIHVSSTIIDGWLFIRICILSFRSHVEDVNEALRAIFRALMVI